MISFEEWPTWKCKVYSVLFHCPVQLCGVGTLWCALVGISSCLKKTRHGLNWKHWNMIEDKSVTCTACMFLVLQLQKFKLKANSKASVGSERSFSEQIQPWSASPIARSSVHVCLWFLRQACGGSILYFFVWSCNVFLHKGIFVFTAIGTFDSLSSSYFSLGSARA